jgi:hypothetical protein
LLKVRLHSFGPKFRLSKELIVRRADIDSPKVRCSLVSVFRWFPASSEFLFYPVFFHSNAICQHYITSLSKSKKLNLRSKGGTQSRKSKGIGKIEQRQRQKDNTKTKNIHKRRLSRTHKNQG